MKIGVITHSFNKPTKECLYDAASLSLDGVQIYATMGEFSFEELTEEKKAEFKAVLKETGLEVSALCGDMHGHGFEREEENAIKVEKTKQIIDLAVEFNRNILLS